mgnify:FL=1
MQETKSVCIICGKEKPGIEVKPDFVIESIRWIKRNITKNEKGNRLVVCRDCYPAYRKLRERFERREKIYLTLGILFALLSFLLSSNKLYGLGIGLLVIALLYLFSLLNYMPSLNIEAVHGQERDKVRAKS